MSYFLWRGKEERSDGDGWVEKCIDQRWWEYTRRRFCAIGKQLPRCLCALALSSSSPFIHHAHLPMTTILSPFLLRHLSSTLINLYISYLISYHPSTTLGTLNPSRLDLLVNSVIIRFQAKFLKNNFSDHLRDSKKNKNLLLFLSLQESDQ